MNTPSPEHMLAYQISTIDAEQCGWAHHDKDHRSAAMGLYVETVDDAGVQHVVALCDDCLPAYLLHNGWLQGQPWRTLHRMDLDGEGRIVAVQIAGGTERE